MPSPVCVAPENNATAEDVQWLAKCPGTVPVPAGFPTEAATSIRPEYSSGARLVGSNHSPNHRLAKSGRSQIVHLSVPDVDIGPAFFGWIFMIFTLSRELKLFI